MKNTTKSFTAVAIVLLLMFTLAACGSKNEEGSGQPTVRVGSKDFTENLLVGELYALALEDAGYKVERVFNIAGSVIHTSLINDEIDLYPEYTGTGLLTILKKPLMTDPEEVYNMVKMNMNNSSKSLGWITPKPMMEQGWLSAQLYLRSWGLQRFPICRNMQVGCGLHRKVKWISVKTASRRLRRSMVR